MKYSIIIPIYNAINYIEECLNSIYLNKYEDFEVLCLDDESSDGTYQWINSHISQYPRLRLIKLSHIGVSGIRNIGIAESKGEYICWLDSDDCISSNYFNILDQILDGEKDCTLISWTREKKSLFHGEINFKLDVQQMNKEKVITEYLLSKRPCYCWSIITKKEYYNEIIYPTVHTFEDLNQNHALIQMVKQSISVINKPLYYYRDNLTSIVSSINTKKRIDIFLAWKKRCEFANVNYNSIYPSCYSQFVISGYLAIRSLLYSQDVHKEDMKILFDNFNVKIILQCSLPIYKKMVVLFIYILGFFKYKF